MALDLETRDALVETVRRFVREKCVPIEAKVSEDDRVPDAVIAEMRELGLFGLSIPEDYGGLGLTMEEEVLVCFELGQTSPAFRSVIGTNVGIGSQGVVMFGTEAQKVGMAAEARERRDRGELRPNRTRRGLRCRLRAHRRHPRRRSLCRQRHQALHHQCEPRGHVHLAGAQRPVEKRRGRNLRLHRPGENAGHLRSASPRRRWASRARISAT